MSWPSVPNALVEMRLGAIGTDDGSPGPFPAWYPLEGYHIKLTPGRDMVVFDGVVAPLKPILATIDAEGWLRTAEGAQVRLAATDDPRMSTTGWLWTAEMDQGRVKVKFPAPANGVVNIADYIEAQISENIQHNLDQLPALIDAINNATDLANIANIATTARDKADTAQTDSEAAVQIAQTILSQVSQFVPGTIVSHLPPSAEDGTGLQTGVIWEVHIGNILRHRYVWSGEQWLNIKLGATAIGDGSISDQHIENLSVGKLVADGAEFPEAVIDVLTTNDQFAKRISASRVFVGDTDNIWRDVTFNGIEDTVWTRTVDGKMRKNGTGALHGSYFSSTEVTAYPGDNFYSELDVEGNTSGKVEIHIQRQNPTTGAWAHMGVAYSGTPGQAPDTYISPEVPAGISQIRFGVFTSAAVSSSQHVAIKSIRILRRNGSVMIENGGIRADHLDTDALDFKKAKGLEVESGTITSTDYYSPSPTVYPHVHIGSSAGTGMKVSRMDNDGAPYDAIKLGGAEADEIMIYQPGVDAPLAGFRPDGSGMATRFDVDDLYISGEPLPDYLEPFATGVRGNWNGVLDFPKAGGTDLGIMSMRASLVAGRWYRIVLEGYISADTVGDYARITLKQGWNNPNIGIGASNIRYIDIHTRSWKDPVRFEAMFHANQTNVSDFLFVIRNITATNRGVWFTSGGSVSHAYVEDMGPAPLITGKASTGGGVPLHGTPIIENPVQGLVETYSPVWIRSWRGGSSESRHMYHGNYGGVQRYSMIGFPAKLGSDLSGKTIQKVELWLKNNHAFYYAGMTTRIGYSTQATAPGSPVTSGTASSHHWGRGQGKWVTLPLSGFTSSTRAITLGVGAGTSNQGYGYFSNSPSNIKLRVTARG